MFLQSRWAVPISADGMLPVSERTLPHPRTFRKGKGRTSSASPWTWSAAMLCY